MIKSFVNKELRALWETSKINPKMHRRILLRLAALNNAVRVDDVNINGFNFHKLHGFTPQRYTIHINGPWCITFEFEKGHAYQVDFEQYH